MNFLLPFLLALLSAGGAAAQQANPISWTYEVKQLDKETFQLIFHAALEHDYHIFSQKPGGDGFLIPPSFEFSDNIKKVGDVKEVGKLIHAEMDGIDGTVHYYEGKVDFTQDVKGRPGSAVTVKHRFQICNSSTCLPPKTLDHTFTLSP